MSINQPWTIFVDQNDQNYIQDGIHRQITRFTSNSKKDRSVMKIESSCSGLFIDLNHSIYCSILDQDFLIRQSLLNNPSTFPMGQNGFKGNQFNNPRGISVDHLLNLYVCDCSNDRIQLFEYQTNQCKTSFFSTFDSMKWLDHQATTDLN